MVVGSRENWAVSEMIAGQRVTGSGGVHWKVKTGEYVFVCVCVCVCVRTQMTLIRVTTYSSAVQFPFQFQFLPGSPPKKAEKMCDA